MSDSVFQLAATEDYAEPARFDAPAVAESFGILYRTLKRWVESGMLDAHGYRWQRYARPLWTRAMFAETYFLSVLRHNGELSVAETRQTLEYLRRTKARFLVWYVDSDGGRHLTSAETMDAAIHCLSSSQLVRLFLPMEGILNEANRRFDRLVRETAVKTPAA